MKPKPIKKFSTVVHAIRGSLPTTRNPCVDVPASIVSRLQSESGKKQAIPVHLTLEGKPFKANIVRYLGDWRLYLNGPMLKSAKVAVGDKVGVTLRFDPVIRREPMHPALAKALAVDLAAKQAFLALPPSRRKEFFRYLNALKRADTLKLNIDRLMKYLAGKKTGLSPTGLFRTGKARRGKR